MEFGRIWGNSGNFGKTQGNSMEFGGVLYGAWYEFNGSSWGISGQRRIFGKIWGLEWFRVIWGVKSLLRKNNHVQPMPIVSLSASAWGSLYLMLCIGSVLTNLAPAMAMLLVWRLSCWLKLCRRHGAGAHGSLGFAASPCTYVHCPPPLVFAGEWWPLHVHSPL